MGHDKGWMETGLNQGERGQMRGMKKFIFLTDDFITFLICYKIPNRSISTKKGFILAHSFRGNKSIMLDQHHGGGHRRFQLLAS